MPDSPMLPDFFEPLLAEQFGPDDVKRVLAGSNTLRPVTLRVNTLRATLGEVESALDVAGIGYQHVAWYDDALIISDERERAIWDLPIYKEGKIYLQSLSSMIPVLVLNPQPGEDICDLCAAPGGKTTQIAALTQNRAYITACEMHAPRAEKLEYNLKKLGTRNATVMRVDARNLDDFFSFDRILLDAPCSGSGTLKAEDARAAKRFTPSLVQKSTKSQRALLLKALGLLKPGGTLVYSTCSVLARENEDIVEGCLREAKRKGAFELQPIISHSQDADGEASFPAEAVADFPLLPTRLEQALCLAPTDLYEGFFIAKIKRTG